MTACPVCGIAAPWGCAACAAPEQAPAFVIEKHSARTRADGLRRLAAELQQRDMAREDVDELLGVCPSSARNYLNDLLKAGIAQRALFGESEFMRTGAQVYRIADDSARVAAYIGGGPIPAGPSLAAAMRDPGRHFHFAMDDTPFHIKAHRGPVRADPMALPVAFFRASEGVRV